MSQKIRQGNDIRIRWSILDADEHPYILEGRNVAVELNVGTKRVRIKSLEIESNVLIFTYYGKDQKYTGSYILKFIENEGQVDMVTFDTKDAFTLVEHSWQAIDEGETPETVQLEFVTVTSELHSSVGPAGDPAGFGEVTASVDGGVGTPSVEVTTSGPDTAKNFAFAFHNLKGQDGSDADVTAQNIQSALGYVPVAPADISRFITKSVNDLTNYYLKSETYTKAEVEALVAGISGVSFVVANSLPTASASTMGKIYLIPSADPQTQNVKDEFITLESGGSYSWEQIGSTAIDLDGYVTDEDLATALADYVLSSSITDVLRYSSQSLTTEQQTQARTNIGAGTYSKPSGGIPSSDMASAVQTSLGKADSAYQKPSTGIPSTDMASAVQTSLGKADTAYQKPSGGIPAADIASGVIPAPEAFIAEYDVTTLAELITAYNAGKLLVVESNGTFYNLFYARVTSGDEYFSFVAVMPEDGMMEMIWINGTDGWVLDDYNLFSGDYSDLTNAPTIPSALSDLSDDSTHRLVTDTEKSTWNGKYAKPAAGIPASDLASGVIPDVSGKYEKPSTGIPKTDLAQGVQDSLALADSALQSFTETDPTVPSWAKAQNPPTEIFWATYGTTTAAEIDAAVQAGKVVICRYSNTDYSLVKYDANDSYIYFGALLATSSCWLRLQRSNTSWVAGLQGLEVASNKVTSLSSSSTDTEYPSAKCVYDLVGDIETLLAAI